MEEAGHLDESINVWRAAALLVHADCTGTEVEFLRQLQLIHPHTSTEPSDSTG